MEKGICEKGKRMHFYIFPSAISFLKPYFTASTTEFIHSSLTSSFTSRKPLA